jgi:hypothetical protein
VGPPGPGRTPEDLALTHLIDTPGRRRAPWLLFLGLGLGLGGALATSGRAAGADEPPPPARRWYALANYPGWEAYGPIDPADGRLVMEWKRPAPDHDRVVAARLAAARAAAEDPYGFLAWLNGVRAGYGLGPVGHDPGLSSWAAANNGQQQARGLGHHVRGPARRQNAGMGSGGAVWQQWMVSPAHQAALLDPTIRWIGIAAGGSYWTFNGS